MDACGTVTTGRTVCRLVLSAVLLCVALPTAARELVLLTWPEYIDPALVAEFERLHEVTLRQAFFDSDEERDELMIATGVAASISSWSTRPASRAIASAAGWRP